MAKRNDNSASNRARLDKIYDVFDKLGVDIDKEAIWEVQGTPVVKHKDVERLGAKMGIKWDKPQILRAEAYEAVMIVFGSVGDKMEWSVGEAKIMEMIDTGKNNQWGKPIRAPAPGCFGNYIVTGSQAAYPYAMAEKRAKDRVILKLADLHGDAYSSEEADDFRNPQNADRQVEGKSTANNDNVDPSQLLADIKADISKTKSVKDLTDLMNSKDMKDDLKKLSKDEEGDAKAFATSHLKENLGWTAPAKDKAAS
ncbi:hypothetical protein [Bradyrhizobium ottawaense]|uniref:Phage recombination protein Bet n=1 Tax=Bradyrhizobium ottawaense TaxID=931866 RepID=A0ABY0QHL8_9BRAD|nr:hypothetical protein [Bradyrhizobium ottawaense]SDK45556.1 hypothetical protein SAMN05444163_8153 [Bradyrhizobium ottawaense]